MIGESLYPSALNQFSVRDGCLIMEGVPLIRLVKHAGLVGTGVGRTHFVVQVEVYAIQCSVAQNFERRKLGWDSQFRFCLLSFNTVRSIGLEIF